MNEHLTLLIVGGYGTFGGRLVQLLEGEPRLTLIVAGRSLERARAYCQSRGETAAKLVAATFDRAGDLAAALAALKPDILVDASGPFQAYGSEPYRLIEACIANGVDYLDLADGSDFVAGVGKFDAQARAAGRYVLSGVSSFPVLTAAVVRRLAAGMARIDSIHAGIAPSPFAGVGENVIRAMAGQAGQRIVLTRDGKAAVAHPFTEQMRFTIAPPGRIPLHNRLFSLVDAPDLRVLPELWPQTSAIWMGAAPVPEIWHRALIAFAWLVRARLIPTLSTLAPLMHFVTNRLRWGERRGGMFVAVTGASASGAALERSWHLLAEGDDGPFIPSMAVAALMRRALDGQLPLPGARAGVRDVELADYERLFASRTMYTGIREPMSVERKPLYARILGSAWSALPREIRTMHDNLTTLIAEGRASVERGSNPLARFVAAIARFPSVAADVPVRVRFDVGNGIETWTRTFGDQPFSSRQFAGQERSAHLLREQFGPLTFAMALVPQDGRLYFVVRGWSVWGVPLPLWLCPRSNASESVRDGRFHFDVEITHPLVGLIVRYRGWLVPRQSD